MFGNEKAGAGWVASASWGARVPMAGEAATFLRLVGNLRAGHRQQPGFEGALGGIVSEALDAFGHAEDGFLDDLLRLRMREAALEREAVDELPLGVEEVAPTAVIVPILEPPQQAGARRNQIRRAIVSGRLFYHA